MKIFQSLFRQNLRILSGNQHIFIHYKIQSHEVLVSSQMLQRNPLAAPVDQLLIGFLASGRNDPVPMGQQIAAAGAADLL